MNPGAPSFWTYFLMKLFRSLLVQLRGQRVTMACLEASKSADRFDSEIAHWAVAAALRALVWPR
eukprot:2337786-Alexandrium_andersonii.AAC.1